MCCSAPFRHRKVIYKVCRTRFRAPRARQAREARIFFKNFFCQDVQLILMHQVSKQSFLGRLCSKRNAFSRAAGAPGARSGIFFHESISFVKTVPTRYHTSMGRVGKCVFIPRDTGIQRGRRDITKIYIKIYYNLRFILQIL